MPPSAWSYLVGSLIAGVVFGAIVAALRWIRRGAPDRRRHPRFGDFGLLRAVALTANANTAEAVRRRLDGAGIRSTVATDPDGRIRVLVFVDELDRARRVAQRLE